jgi:hypothetical protein
VIEKLLSDKFSQIIMVIGVSPHPEGMLKPYYVGPIKIRKRGIGKR